MSGARPGTSKIGRLGLSHRKGLLVKTHDHELVQDCHNGCARGWTNECVFARHGDQPSSDGDALRVVVLNIESGTAGSIAARRALLTAAIERVGDSGPTLLVTPAGFFGFGVAPDGAVSWTGVADITLLENDLSRLARSWPTSLMVAVGVDRDSDDQRQWWFCGGEGRRRCEISRSGTSRDATPLSQRRVTHAGYTLLGFVCGEAYEWPQPDLAADLPGIDIVVISAHVEVNRIWDREIDPGLKRWAFQRRFQFIAQHAGAALAHARGIDDAYVRNCDDWFVHRGNDPFPGPRVGQPIG